MIPIPYNDTGPPKTRTKAWLQAINLFAILIVFEAIWAGMFAMGVHGIYSGVVGDELFNALLMAIMGILAATFWPIIIWDTIKEAILFAWKFKK